VAIVEHWNPWAKIRQDLFGFGDLLAIAGMRTIMESHSLDSIHVDPEAILVQTTTKTNMAARIKKIKDDPKRVRAAWAWLSIRGHSIQIHGWKKNKLGKWVCDSVLITKEDLK
jgi:hypothetical protein